MRNRVLDAVAALGYEPDVLAKSMRTGQTMTVGFIVSDISNPLISEIALGAETILREAGYSMIVVNSMNEPAVEARAHLVDEPEAHGRDAALPRRREPPDASRSPGTIAALL